jgi:peptidoglycan/xylan/chitin deacetylase (PgdA/CDA1 family)
LWSQALPILERFGIPAVAFIPSGEVGAEDSEPDAQRLSWKQVQALPGYGVAVGSHARQHQSLGALSRDQVGVQAGQSRRELEAQLGSSVTAFAYPFGTRADYNKMTAEVVQDVGYRWAFTAQHGAIRVGTAPYTLPRVKVEGGEGLWMFKLLVKGGLDAWGWVDRLLWRWQQSEKG